SDSVSFTLLQEPPHSVLDPLSAREPGAATTRLALNAAQPTTLAETGNVYGATRERLRPIESKTMAKLRHPSRSQLLRDYPACSPTASLCLWPHRSVRPQA